MNNYKKEMRCLLILFFILFANQNHSILGFTIEKKLSSSKGNSHGVHSPRSVAEEEMDSLLLHHLPKIELHAHLHGSVRTSTLVELIQRQNLSHRIDKVTLDEKDIGHSNKPFELFPLVHQLVNTLPIVKRILSEMIEDYWKENTIYLEIRSSPRVLSGDGKGMEEYVRSLVQEIARLNDQYAGKILTKLILSIDRSKSLNDAKNIYELAKQYEFFSSSTTKTTTTAAVEEEATERQLQLQQESKQRVIVGIDFAGNPEGGRFEDFRDLFETALNDGFHTTIHTAEIKELSESKSINLSPHDSPSNADDETSVILNFRPDRFGHFLHMKNHHFVKLLQFLKEERAPLIEICPTTSFYLLGLRSYADHPHIRKLLQHQYPFSLNTDDSGIFNSNITQEIRHMYYAIEMTLTDVVHSLENSIEYAFLQKEEKLRLQEFFWKKMARLLAEFPKSQQLKDVFSGDEIDMSSLYTM